MEADESRPRSALSPEGSVPAHGAGDRPQQLLHPLSLGTVPPGLGCCRGTQWGPTSLSAPAVLWDAHLYEGMGLLLRGVSLLPLGDAVLVCQFVLQLHGGSGHFLTPVQKIVAADGKGLERQSGTLEEGIRSNLSSVNF